MTKEMWDYTNDGQLYFERAVNDFLPLLFQKWKTLGATHLLTIICTSRTYYTKNTNIDALQQITENNLLHCLLSQPTPNTGNGSGSPKQTPGRVHTGSTLQFDEQGLLILLK